MKRRRKFESKRALSNLTAFVSFLHPPVRADDFIIFHFYEGKGSAHHALQPATDDARMRASRSSRRLPPRPATFDRFLRIFKDMCQSPELPARAEYISILIRDMTEFWLKVH